MIFKSKNDAYIFLLYLPPIITPILFGMEKVRELKEMKDSTKNFLSRSFVFRYLFLSLLFVGVLSLRLLWNFNALEINIGIIMALIGITFLVSWLSLSLLSILRLYYLIKHKDKLNFL